MGMMYLGADNSSIDCRGTLLSIVIAYIVIVKIFKLFLCLNVMYFYTMSVFLNIL